MTTTPRITPRQVEIISGLERHLTLKEISHELGISESALNKQISALKSKFGAQSHREILQGYYKITGREDGSFSAGRNPPLQTVNRSEAGDLPNEAGLLHFADAGSFIDPTWANVFEPRIVPRWLDGDNFVLARLGAIVGLLILMLALPVLGVAMLDTLAGILQAKTQTS